LEKNWYAIYVSSRAEKKIGETLQSKGIEAYVPLVKTMRQWSDRKKIVEIPLLNGYVFVKINQHQSDNVLQIKGVVNFVKIEGKTALIREEEIGRLRQLVELGYQLEAGGISKSYNPGDKVRINSGALCGLEGYVIDTSSGKNLEVLLESIGQCIRVRLPKDIFNLV
jgi:transcription antitermination factor NusG